MCELKYKSMGKDIREAQIPYKNASKYSGVAGEMRTREKEV